MGEKTETDDFDEDADDAALDGDDDVERVTKELEYARRRGNSRNATPAWRRLELRMEEKRTAELTSDFKDYNLDEPRKPPRSARR